MRRNLIHLDILLYANIRFLLFFFKEIFFTFLVFLDRLQDSVSDSRPVSKPMWVKVVRRNRILQESGNLDSMQVW